MNTTTQLKQLPDITIGDLSGKPSEIHELYNHAGYVLGYDTDDGLKFVTISYTLAAKLVEDHEDEKS